VWCLQSASTAACIFATARFGAMATAIVHPFYVVIFTDTIEFCPQDMLVVAAVAAVVIWMI
jgi:hypothetical protein